MRKIRTLLFLLALTLSIPSSSYALFDAGAYGGYTFSGEVMSLDGQKGANYGIIAHYNKSLLVFFDLGLGAYGQISNLSDYDRKSVGIDTYFLIDIPIFPIDPYAKFAFSIYENYSGTYSPDSGAFKTYSPGAGLVLSLPVIPVEMFGEYQYTKSWSGNKEKSHSVIFGIRLNI